MTPSQSNPTPRLRRSGYRVDARVEEIDRIVGVGGGSVIDVAKVLSLALADRSRELGARFLDPDTRGKTSQPIPMVAVPTTAGTGSEVTPFATVWDAGDEAEALCRHAADCIRRRPSSTRSSRRPCPGR